MQASAPTLRHRWRACAATGRQAGLRLPERVPRRLRKRVPEPIDPADRKATEVPSRDEELTKLAEDWQMSYLLQRLPHIEGQLLEMRFVNDMSQSEIAAETGMALGTVKMRMVQGLRRLRELMDEEGEVAL